MPEWEERHQWCGIVGSLTTQRWFLRCMLFVAKEALICSLRLVVDGHCYGGNNGDLFDFQG